MQDLCSGHLIFELVKLLSIALMTGSIATLDFELGLILNMFYENILNLSRVTINGDTTVLKSLV